ncbi:substrate-binding periplasmic protein [Thalassotalea ganghwensis]
MQRLFILLLISWSCLLPAKQPKIWKITSLEWPPFAGENLEGQGIAISTLRSLLLEHNVELVVEFMPWSLAQQKATLNEYVGYYPAWRSEIAPGFIASQAIVNSQLALMSLNNDIKTTNLDDLFTRFNIGVVDSYTYPSAIDYLIKSYTNNMILFTSDQEMLRGLEKGNIDIAIAEPKVFEYFAKQSGTQSPQVLLQFENQPLVIALRDQKDNKAAISILEIALTETSLENAKYIKPKKLLASMVNVPEAQKLADFFIKVYNDIGITLEVRTAPARRGLSLLNAGIVDADIARIANNVRAFESIKVVEPAISGVSATLLCRKETPCNREILNQSYNTIVTGLGEKEALDLFDIKARLVFNENIANSIELLKNKRTNFIIYPTTVASRKRLSEEFNVVELRKLAINHVIHKKHSSLLPELERAIATRLDELDLENN